MASDSSAGRYELLSSFEIPSINDAISNTELTFLAKVAAGGMSEIYLCDLGREGGKMRVAVKTLTQRDNMTRNEMDFLRMEANILTRIQHDNVIRTYGTVNTQRYGLGLVLDYYPYGSYVDFFDHFWEKQSRTRQVEEVISHLKIRILEEVIKAMEYLHRPNQLFASHYKEKCILHLDLKGQNVLLDNALHAKICDFGLSSISTLTHLRTSRPTSVRTGGTHGYIAPERLRTPNYLPDKKCDVYSFGILQYVVVTDSAPYQEHISRDFTLLEYHIAKNNLRPNVTNIPACYPLRMENMMKSCWSPDPQLRPSFAELVSDIASIVRGIRDFNERCENAVRMALAITKGSHPVPVPLPRPAGKSFRSSKKALISVVVAIIFFVTLITGLAATRSNSSPIMSTAKCPPVKNITFGRVTCEAETKATVGKCHFSCDQGYGMMGSKSTTCNGGRWSNKEPSCELACKPVTFASGMLISCTNQSFINSICSFSCQNNHILQGVSTATCLKTGNWSAPPPFCVCPNCTTGKNCENPVSWQSVTHYLDSLDGFGRMELNYGGKVLVCSNKLSGHGLSRFIDIKWSGICTDKITGTQAICSHDHASPSGSTKAAAAVLIQRLVKQKLFPAPCDDVTIDSIC